MPSLRGARGARDGKLERLIGAPLTSLTARLLGQSPAKWAGRSAEEFVAALRGNRDVADLARMTIRVSTYAADLERLPADLAVAQMKMGLFRGVSYLDGGWASLVEGLLSVATSAGVAIRAHEPATGITGGPGGWGVALTSGEVLPASAVVIAAGGPATARKLVPADPGWRDIGRPVTAACLDLGLQGHPPALTFGIDDPLYLSRHCPPGDLAPSGGSLVHVMRYGARHAGLDRAELRSFARLAGITDDQIVEERFLADMVVTHVLPSPEQGLAGRPGVTSTGAEGIYLAGDWVGPTGWLSDAAMASGREAGRLAAGAAAPRTYPRVA
jgi:phytoene dehydrogenase-like protein